MPKKPRLTKQFLLWALPAVAICLGGAGLHPNAEELITLKEQGDEEAAKEKETAAYHESFGKVRDAIAGGQLKAGTKSSDIKSRYGPPVATAQSPGGARWLYKARSRKKWFEVPRVWLYFDDKNKLSRWDCAYTDCPSN